MKSWIGVQYNRKVKMSPIPSDVYIVKKGDTLSGIAKKTGHSLGSLVRFNSIKNPNKIEVGQAIYLSERAAFSVQALFLDALRHPIENLAYRLVIDGKVHQGKTRADGLTEQKVSRDARSKVEIHSKDYLGNWQQLGSTISDYGQKLITLVSPYVSFKDQLEPHPPEAPSTPQPTGQPDKPKATQPPLPPKPAGPPSKNNPSVRPQKTKGRHGESVIKIGIDLPQDLLQYMQAYEDKPITEKDWERYAGFLECEVNMLKAIGQKESKGSAFWQLQDGQGAHVPAILYERHFFRRLTKGRYDQSHPDLSGPFGKAYGPHSKQYLRLLNAYRLDPSAALMSASWGMFQILGANYMYCGYRDVRAFVEKMCKNEQGQLDMLARFIRNKPSAWKDPKNKALGKRTSLWGAVKTKDWPAIAFNFNGPAYRTNHYDTDLKAIYEKLCNRTA
jgi:LysM repeat protein